MMSEPGQTAVTIPFDTELQPARFVERPNRFLVRCRLVQEAAETEDGAEAAATQVPVEAHLPDPGRLTELLLPGRRLWLEPAGSPQRKTRWTVRLSEAPDGQRLVSLDTTLPNRLIEAALRQGALDELAGWTLVRREFRKGASRFDFLLQHEDGRHLILEVKSVTLVEDGVGLFPDAITARGRRHVEELTAVAGQPGWEAAVLFVLQRRDGMRVQAAPAIDAEFAAALAQAKAAGVRVLARRCAVKLDGVVLGRMIPAG